MLLLLIVAGSMMMLMVWRVAWSWGSRLWTVAAPRWWRPPPPEVSSWPRSRILPVFRRRIRLFEWEECHHRTLAVVGAILIPLQYGTTTGTRPNPAGPSPTTTTKMGVFECLPSGKAWWHSIRQKKSALRQSHHPSLFLRIITVPRGFWRMSSIVACRKLLMMMMACIPWIPTTWIPSSIPYRADRRVRFRYNLV